MNIQITSRLDSTHSASLERLFYFHPEQSDFTEGILEEIGNSGSPQLAKADGNIGIHLPKIPEAQTLYALDRSGSQEILLGVMVFTRRDRTTLQMLHIAVSPEHTHLANQGHSPVTVALVGELCRLGATIRGVELVVLAYGRGKIAIGK